MTAPTIYCDECGASNALQATHCFACSKALQALAPLPLIPSQTQSASANTLVPANKVISPLVASYLLHSRYSIVEQIGTGGFGAVYQAKDTLFSHRSVAIKEMSQDGLSTRELAEATAAFEREALLLADLTHPNLPRIHDHFTKHGRSYVVMDFIAGDTLEDYLDKIVRRIPVEAALEIGIQLCAVLDYLHNQQPPIIFRDLKPANIMRTADNHVYLIDFGIARHFQPGKAKDTIPLGSKGYAAPEQYGKAQTTPQSDIYGLGVTLHELLTGDDPSLTPFHFEAVNVGKSPITAQLNALLKQMVEMEMSKRPASMAAVKRTLQGLIAQQTAQKPGPAQRSSSARIKRRNFLLGFVSVVAVCSGSSAITAFVFGKRNEIDMSTIHPLLGNTPVPAPATPTAPLPTNARLLSKTQYTYRGHEGAVTAVAWSPHGEHIASAGTVDSSVQVWDANTGNIIMVPALEIDPTEKRLPRSKGRSYSPDTKHALPLAGPMGRCRVWTFGKAKSTIDQQAMTLQGDVLVYRGHSDQVMSVSWSPDGEHIASGSEDGTVQLWQAK